MWLRSVAPVGLLGFVCLLVVQSDFCYHEGQHGLQLFVEGAKSFIRSEEPEDEPEPSA